MSAIVSDPAVLVETPGSARVAAVGEENLTAIAGAAAGWQRAVEALHSAAPHPAIVAADGAIVMAVVLGEGGTRENAAMAAASFLVVALLSQLYRRRSSIEAQGVLWYLRLLPLPLLAMGCALSVTGDGHLRTVLTPVAAAAVVLGLLRASAWLALAHGRRCQFGLRDALAVGPPDQVRQLRRRVAGFPEAGLRIVASYDPTLNGHGGAERQRVQQVLEAGTIRQILFAAEGHDSAVVTQCARWSGGAEIDCALVLPVEAGLRTGVARIGDLGVVPLGRLMTGCPPLRGKRALDIVLSAFLLLLLAPVLAAVSLAIWLHDRGPVLYRQRRVGRDNQVFDVWKFRSMVPDADRLNGLYARANINNGLLFKVRDDPRVTPIGRVIRRLSIDELPQLFNVLRGHMSLVGPRPLPVEPEDFDHVARQRHHVRPGITGPWQVSGGHVLEYDDMIKLDLAYIDGWSLRRDLWFLLMTIPAVLVRRSAY